MTLVEQTKKEVEATMQNLINLAQNTSVSTFIINYLFNCCVLRLILAQAIENNISYSNSFYAFVDD